MKVKQKFVNNHFQILDSPVSTVTCYGFNPQLGQRSLSSSPPTFGCGVHQAYCPIRNGSSFSKCKAAGAKLTTHPHVVTTLMGGVIPPCHIRLHCVVLEQRDLF